MSLLADGFLARVYQVLGEVGIRYLLYAVVVWLLITAVRSAPEKINELGKKLSDPEKKRLDTYKKSFFIYAVLGFAGGLLMGVEVGFLETIVAEVPLRDLLGFGSLVFTVLAMIYGLKLKEFFLLKEAGREAL